MAQCEKAAISVYLNMLSRLETAIWCVPPPFHPDYVDVGYQARNDVIALIEELRAKIQVRKTEENEEPGR
jgi:uncharacterized Fe-S center protein